MSAVVAVITLALPLAAAAAGHDASAAPARAGGVAFSSFDLVLLVGGAVAVVAVGSGTRRLLRDRA